MNKSVVLGMAMALGVTASAYAANPFSDVPANSWAYDAVNKLAAEGIIDGYPNGILEYELVQIVDVENGNRFETYTIAGEAGSGMICLNGAAARQVAVGDHVILMCYAQMTPEEAKEHHPKVVFVDADNHIARVTNYEKHGKLTDDFIGA